MIKYAFKIIFLTILIIISQGALSYSAENDNSIDEYSPENILGFTRYLISKEEYYRAYTELKRLNSYYPGYISAEQYYTTGLFLLFIGRQYDEIIGLHAGQEKSAFPLIYSVFKTDAYLYKDEFIKARDASANYRAIGTDAGLNIFLFKRTLLSYILLDKMDEADTLYKEYEFSNNPEFKIHFNEIRKYSIDYRDSFKKPCLGSLLGIIPGMGYVYAGKPATGVFAFIVVSVFSGLTYFSFKTDNKPIGIFAGIAGSFFYGGSILGGYLSAKRYNDSLMREYSDSLFQKFSLANDRQGIFEKYGIRNSPY